MLKISFLPNILTILRIILTPFCLYFLFTNYIFLSFSLFLVASFTDTLDGYFARKFNAISKLGTFLDPLADKLLVVSLFIAFYYIYPEIIDLYILSMILFRDVFVTILRIVMEKKGTTMTTSNLSKIKTTVQMIMIILIFINSMYLNFNLNDHTLYYLMFATSILTFYTGLHYLFSNYKELKILILDK